MALHWDLVRLNDLALGVAFDKLLLPTVNNLQRG